MLLKTRRQAEHDSRADGAGFALRLSFAHDPAPSSGRPRRPRLSRRRLVVRLPRLFPVDPAGPEVQLSIRPAADRSGAPVRHQDAAVRPGGGGGGEADPSRDHLRQVGGFVPPDDVSGLQEPPVGPAGRSDAAVSADARDRPRLRHDPGRAGQVRGRRPDRDLRQAGARGRRRRHDRLGRQGPHAAHRAGRLDVRPRLGRPRGAAHRAGGSRRLFRSRRGQGGRHPGAGGRTRPTTCRARPASGSRPRRS